MFEMLRSWYVSRFSDPQAMGLAAILLFGFVAIYFFSGLIAPLLIAIVLAYLLNIPCHFLTQKLRIPRLLSISIMLTLFISLMLAVVFVLLPNLLTQGIRLMSDLPTMFNRLHEWVLALPENYPALIDYQMVDSFFGSLRTKILGAGESVVKLSLSSLVNLVTIGIYAFLVPLMMFFLLKDQQELGQYISRFLPQNRVLANQVWLEMKQQIANYIHGKVLEIVIVTVVTYAIFLVFNLNYALLLAVAVGFSVLVPYVGAVLVSIPVVLVAFFQFGDHSTFWYIIIAFVVSQILDGNVLVPFLFSEAVNLHPLTIIVAVLIFGGLWGFWGVFFAIPLATLVKAVVNSWPTAE